MAEDSSNTKGTGRPKMTLELVGRKDPGCLSTAEKTDRAQWRNGLL